MNPNDASILELIASARELLDAEASIDETPAAYRRRSMSRRWLERATRQAQVRLSEPVEPRKLGDALREHLSPHAVALLVSKCRPTFGKGEDGHAAERQVQWLAEHLTEMLGAEQLKQLCEEVGV